MHCPHHPQKIDPWFFLHIQIHVAQKHMSYIHLILPLLLLQHLFSAAISSVAAADLFLFHVFSSSSFCLFRIEVLFNLWRASFSNQILTEGMRRHRALIWQGFHMAWFSPFPEFSEHYSLFWNNNQHNSNATASCAAIAWVKDGRRKTISCDCAYLLPLLGAVKPSHAIAHISCRY